MTGRILFFLVAVCSLISCKSLNVSENVKQVQLDMSRNQVTQLMGNDFNVVNLSKAPNGENIEVLKYTESIASRTHDDKVIIKTNNYIFHFVNNRLVEFYKEEPMPMPSHHGHHKKGHR